MIGEGEPYQCPVAQNNYIQDKESLIKTVQIYGRKGNIQTQIDRKRWQESKKEELIN